MLVLLLPLYTSLPTDDRINWLSISVRPPRCPRFCHTPQTSLGSCLQVGERGSENGSARRPVWLDGAVSAANQAAPPPVPRPASRPKRGMDASPFAGLMSKKPFRRRTFEPIKEEPDSAESAGTATAVEQSSPDTSGDTIHTGNLLSRLPSIPTVVTTNTFMQVSLLSQFAILCSEAERACKIVCIHLGDGCIIYLSPQLRRPHSQKIMTLASRGIVQYFQTLNVVLLKTKSAHICIFNPELPRLLRHLSLLSYCQQVLLLQISISPQIWRTREEAKNLMMKVGLQGIQLDGQNDLQLYLWSTMNPRIVTTGNTS